MDQVFHLAKATRERPRKIVPLHGNGLDVAQPLKTTGEGSLDSLPVQINDSNLHEIVADDPCPLTLVHGTQPAVGRDCPKSRKGGERIDGERLRQTVKISETTIRVAVFCCEYTFGSAITKILTCFEYQWFDARQL